MLHHSGMLLIKAEGKTIRELGVGGEALAIAGYSLEPLFKALYDAQIEPGYAWFLANPHDTFDPGANPWDLAHAKASESVYAEPDLLLETRLPPLAVPPSSGPNLHYPPAFPVSPGWHLLPAFTGFESVRGTAMGDGIRIAHLDTGYWPAHQSTPRNVKPGLGWNFWEGIRSTVDPGTEGWFNQPGHGTATIALLAAPNLDLFYEDKIFNGWFGGAPNAEVVPVRISPSVIHLYTRTMAQGICYALAPNGNAKNRCDVITISHGGLPAQSWADAVNHVYTAGIVVAAASGDNFKIIIDFPTHETVWPSRFDRVITVVGATYNKTPYITNDFGEMQGNWGPQEIMRKAIAAYTPNVAWMEYKTVDEWDINGGGTSSSTPQVAAACALWLQLYRTKYPATWRRVEACRHALFASARKSGSSHAGPYNPPDEYLGQGLLYVPDMLKIALAEEGLKLMESDKMSEAPKADIQSLLWRQAVGLPTNTLEKMFEVEAAQIIYRSTDMRLVTANREIESGKHKSPEELRELLRLLSEEPDVSNAIREKIAAVLSSRSAGGGRS